MIIKDLKLGLYLVKTDVFTKLFLVRGLKGGVKIGGVLAFLFLEAFAYQLFVTYPIASLIGYLIAFLASLLVTLVFGRLFNGLVGYCGAAFFIVLNCDFVAFHAIWRFMSH